MTRSGRPRLAYVFHPRSFPTLDIVEAAQDLCELVWIVDTADPRVDAMPRLLARVGAVVDVAGTTPAEASRLVAAHEPSGILGLADELLEYTAALADALGLPSHSIETAHRLTDKFAQRSAMRAAGLPAPGSWIIDRSRPERWDAILAEATFPAVVKPKRGEGSRDTALAHSVSEARAIVEEGPDQEWVLEEYIPDATDSPAGEGFAGFVSVESYVVDGVVRHLGVTGRTPLAWPFRETGSFIPAAVDATTAGELKEVAAAASSALGVTIGCLHTEIKLTPTGPVVIEVNGRIGGATPEMFSLTTDLEYISLALRIALGEKPDIEEPVTHGVGYRLVIQAPAELRRLVSVTGLAELRAVPGVEAVAPNRSPGDTLDWHDGYDGFVCSVLGTAPDHDALRALLALIPRTVAIEGE